MNEAATGYTLEQALRAYADALQQKIDEQTGNEERFFAEGDVDRGVAAYGCAGGLIVARYLLRTTLVAAGIDVLEEV